MANQTIPWSLIEAEAGGYKAGFVAIFRKYEGQATDERDGAGRVVKVTVASFARHFGIDRLVFDGWVRRDEGRTQSPSRTNEETTKRVLRSVTRNNPEAVIQAIMEAPESVSDRIFHEVKLRRDGEDRSPAARKAAEAGTHEALAPMRRAMATTHIELCIQALEEAAEALAEANAEDAVTSEALARIDKAHEKFVLARHEAAFKVEVGR